MSKDTQARKYTLTINNPDDYPHETIKTIISDNFKSIIYYCMADEKGETLHTHLYIHFSGGVRFSTIKKRFPTAHIEVAKGSAQQNRDYIKKEGKWANDENKTETVIDGTFYEWGEMPVDRSGLCIESAIIERIQDGATNAEILKEFPYFFRALRDVEYVRQSLRNDEYRDKWRDLNTVYIFGATGTGKTRSVMEGHGYSNVYAVNNYKHPFDLYSGESVMLFDEFNSGFRIQDMNNYLDGYPIALPARYNNKQACYDKVYIISNLDLQEQYRNERLYQNSVWQAFIRRIHKVVNFMPDGTRKEYETQDYLSNAGQYVELPEDMPTPFNKGGA